MLCSPTSLPSCLQSSLASERALDGQPSYPWWQKAAGPGTLGGHSPRGLLSHHPWSPFPCLRDVQSSPSLLSRETQQPDALRRRGGCSQSPLPILVWYHRRSLASQHLPLVLQGCEQGSSQLGWSPSGCGRHGECSVGLSPIPLRYMATWPDVLHHPLPREV